MVNMLRVENRSPPVVLSVQPEIALPRQSRHFLAGIYLGFVSDGSPLSTNGDDQSKDGCSLTTAGMAAEFLSGLDLIFPLSLTVAVIIMS